MPGQLSMFISGNVEQLLESYAIAKSMESLVSNAEMNRAYCMHISVIHFSEINQTYNYAKHLPL